jgi:hypothetical protein
MPQKTPAQQDHGYQKLCVRRRQSGKPETQAARRDMFANSRTPTVNGLIILLITSMLKIRGVMRIAIIRGSFGPAKWARCLSSPFS